MAEQEEVPPVPQEGEPEDDNPAYKPPAPKALDDIVNADAEDESLRKYKEALLGKSTTEKVIIDESKGKVIVEKLTLLMDCREPLSFDLTLSPEELKNKSYTIKEGTNYRIGIQFKVQKEIVTGLRYQHKVYRKGVRVETNTHMMGSYGPSYEAYEVKTNEEEAPSGMLMRGDYKIKSMFVDDDKQEYISWEWNLSIKKDWPKEGE